MSVWTNEEIDYNRRLHMITLCIAAPIAAATYPLHVFTSIRLLSSKNTAPIYKLIVLSGYLGIFQFFVHLFNRQLPAFYEFSFIYGFLVAKHLEWIGAYFMTLSYIVLIHCSSLISLNRFLTFRPAASRWVHNTRAFNISLISFVLPLILASIPPIFGGYQYIANPMADGRIVYRPELPLTNILSAAPPLLYFFILAGVCYGLNGYVIYRLVVLRRVASTSTLKSTKNNASEIGLALTSITSIVAEGVFIVFFVIMLLKKTKEAAAVNIIPLTLNTTAPFLARCFSTTFLQYEILFLMWGADERRPDVCCASETRAYFLLLMSAWTYDEIAYNRRLHILTLSIAFPIAFATYPFQVFVSYRLLTSKFTAPIYKLIVLAGFLGIVQFTIHLLIRHLPAFYEFSFIYKHIQDGGILEWIFGYLMALSYTLRVHCAVLIALNRYLTFRPGSYRKLRNERVFRISLISVILPLLLATFTPFFGDYYYVPCPMADGNVVYRLDMPMRNILAVAPPMLYMVLLAVFSYILNGYVIHRLIVLKRHATLKSTRNYASERGLAITSVCTMIAQTVFLVFFLHMLSKKTMESAAFNIIPLTVNTAAPFWVLLATVPTVRKTLPKLQCCEMNNRLGSSIHSPSAPPRTIKLTTFTDHHHPKLKPLQSAMF